MGNREKHPVIHVGIFLGYGRKIPLVNEGLGRLLAFVVAGLVRVPNHRLTVACPYWLVRELKSLFAEHRIDPADYDLLYMPEPWFGRVRHGCDLVTKRLQAWVHARLARPASDPRDHGSPGTGGKKSFRWLRRVFVVDGKRLTSSREWYWVLLEMLKLLAVVAAVLWIAGRVWPAIVAVAVGIVLYRQWRRFRKGRPAKGAGSIARFLSRRARRYRHEHYVSELRLLIDEINRQQTVRHWLIPTFFWPEAHGIEHPKVFVFPDLVMQEVPLRFADPSVEPVYGRLLDTIQRARQVICYSRYIKEKQLVHGVGLAADQIEVIGHGRVDLGGYLGAGNPATDGRERKEVALEVLRGRQITHISGDPYWNRFAWERNPYVFYASQARGQKNILSLLRAVEILRHGEAEPVRLVVTCPRTAGSDLDEFVAAHRLDAWVLFAPEVSNRVLAALYCCASVAVNPTLFEGGFPFTFTEAYSVGTPSLMSDIPMVREKVADSQLRERMLFDPFDPQELANKIGWAVNHREELLELQRPLFESFPTWVEVAGRYSEALVGGDGPRVSTGRRKS